MKTAHFVAEHCGRPKEGGAERGILASGRKCHEVFADLCTRSFAWLAFDARSNTISIPMSRSPSIAAVERIHAILGIERKINE